MKKQYKPIRSIISTTPHKKDNYNVQYCIQYLRDGYYDGFIPFPEVKYNLIDEIYFKLNVEIKELISMELEQPLGGKAVLDAHFFTCVIDLLDPKFLEEINTF